MVTRTTPLSELPELLRVEEAAAYLGVSTTLAYALIQRRELPSVRLGRLLRVPREGLHEQCAEALAR